MINQYSCIIISILDIYLKNFKQGENSPAAAGLLATLFFSRFHVQLAFSQCRAKMLNATTHLSSAKFGGRSIFFLPDIPQSCRPFKRFIDVSSCLFVRKNRRICFTSS